MAVSGAGKKDTIGKPITKELYGIIEKRNLYITGKGEKRPVKYGMKWMFFRAGNSANNKRR